MSDILFFEISEKALRILTFGVRVFLVVETSIYLVFPGGNACFAAKYNARKNIKNTASVK